jgi:peptide/nickel transport system permease protein
MTLYLVRRIIQFVATIFVVISLVFIALHFVADPAAMAFPPGSPTETIEAFRHQYGFDQPLLQQYLDFLRGACTLDFGTSYTQGGDSLSLALNRLPNTLQIAVPAMLIATVVGTATSLLVSRRPNGTGMASANLLSYTAISVPEFWTGIMAILIFSVQLGWFPSGGNFLMPQAIVLPILVLAIRPTARVYQLARTTMTAQYGYDYVLAARAKGASERRVAVRHVLPNTSLPLITLVLYELGHIIAGAAVIVEVVFAWPGIGRLATDALKLGDVFVAQASVAVVAVVVCLLNLFADVLYAVVDPRIRSDLFERKVQ